MRAGDVVADRFEVEERAGAGGMGVVFRARDRHTGERVALKLLVERDEAMVARFLREGRLLAELSHPRIVRYVGHGAASARLCWLALEWLDGEDLAARLKRGGLTLAEALTVARRTAEALAYTHARGVVHRDIKPSNLLLPSSEIDRLKLLDYGIARPGGVSEMTVAGARIGTPAYMSPEQARGVPNLDARVDVFQLGVVLYQCIAGRVPFRADDPIALIGKILLAEPEPLGDAAPGTPRAVERLVHAMLAKEAADRPADARAVIEALDALDDDEEVRAALSGARPGVAAPAALPSQTLTTRERRLVCIVLAEGAGTLVPAEELRRIAEAHGARFDPLVDGSVVLAVTGSGAATDLAARAARAALAMRRAADTLPIALATGRGVVSSTALPVGDVLDRAAALLRTGWARRGSAPNIQEAETAFVAEAPALEAAPIRLDDVTAGLLDASFEIGGDGDGDGLVLRGERPTFETARTLLGKPTPCVARDAELASLEAMFRAAVEEPGARAVLVTAPAGVGKSRLRHELLRRLRAGDFSSTEIMMGRGDPISAGAPFVLLGEALRRAAGLFDGEPLAVRQRKLRGRVARHLPESEVRRVTQVLGELVGTPFDDEGSVQLRAARADAQLLGDQMRAAFTDWLAAECDAGPVVFVLEDLHWGDQPTVAFLDHALRTLADRPLFVLALARPEVHELFPRLWAERDLAEIRLGELGRRAAEKLARQVLGDLVDGEVIARIVERAAGNAFYLEELIRAAAEGRGADGALPETVLAMVQARLETMEPEARQVLRAGSVFGQVFWRGGVGALVGGGDAAATTEVDDWLGELVRREVISARGSGRFRDEPEYVFRHALVREAAYAMLTEADRSLGHRLAARWLAARGEGEALVLAEHHERGGEAAEAAAWYGRAAEQALISNDLAAACARARRGLACTSDETPAALRGQLELALAEAYNWRGEFPDAERAGRAAMGHLPVGGDAWLTAAGEVALAAGVQGRGDLVRALADELDQAALAAGGGGTLTSRILAETRIAEQLIITGNPERAAPILDALERQIDALRADRPDLVGRVLAALALARRFAGDVGAAHALAEDAIVAFERAGDQRNALLQRGRLGYALMEIGDYAAADRRLTDVITASDRMGLGNVAATARHNLGLTLARLGRFDEARAHERAAVAAFRASGNRRMEGASLEYLALIELDAGDPAAAIEAARGACAVAEAEPILPLNLSESLAILGQGLLAAGRPHEALAVARRALEMLEGLGGIDDGEAIIRLTWAEALIATGDTDGGRAAIGAARERLLQRAARIPDEAMRAAFLQRVPENRRTLELAARA
jgi:tetratricopeptide (TPR) repeat protein